MSDVDGIIAAWQRERPDLTVTALHVLSRVDRLAAHLARLRRAAFAAHGLAQHEFDVLAALRRAGAPYVCTPGELAEQTHVTSGTMTNRLDRLAERGLIKRGADPQDGRVARIRLTARGRAKVDAALTDLVDVENRLLTGLSAARQQSIATGLEELLGAAERAAAPAAPDRPRS